VSTGTTRLAGLYAAAAAALAAVLAPLLAMSYFATSWGAEELERGTVSAWAEPGRDLAGGLLTWASPERVYSTYVQAFGLLFAGVFLCALAVRAARGPGRGAERWGWRIALAGYGLAAAGLVGAFLTLIPGDPDSPALNVVFLALMLPGMFVSVIGSTVLGIAFLRRGFRPRATAWLLTLALPSMVAVPTLLGHNSLGMLPLMLAWGAAGLRLWRAPAIAATPATAGAKAG
jgi:hypothetical protein